MKTLNQQHANDQGNSYPTKRNIITFLLLGFMNVLLCQTTFQKSYGTIYDCKLVASQETADGNIIAAGTALPGNIMTPYYTLPGIRERICLIKTNMTGDTLWTKTYGGMDNYRCDAMQQTMDNGFILAGRVVDSIIGDSKIILIKTDANGNMTWTKTYNSMYYNEEVFAVKETATGDYVMAGNAFVGKVDASGNLIWAKDLKTPGVRLRLRSLDHTYDGGIIVGGTIDTTARPYYCYMAKMNGSGNLIWAKTYSSKFNVNEECYAVSQTSDKGFIMAGTTYYPTAPGYAVNHAYLVKTDSLGNLTWSKKFASTANDNGYDVKQTADGGYIITGGSSGIVGNGLWGNNSFLIKTNTTGDISWCNYYGVNGNSSETPASISIMSGGGYIISGVTTDNMMGYPYQLYLLKTDVSGNVNCHGYNWPLFDSVYVSFAHTCNQTVNAITMTTGNTLVNENHFLCSSTDACLPTATGLQNDPQQITKIQVYPNPVKDVLYIDTEILNEYTTVKIYNALGELVLRESLKTQSSSININHLQTGVYFLTIASGTHFITKKIIKE